MIEFPVPVDFVKEIDVGRLYLKCLVRVFEVEVMAAASMGIARQEPLRLEVNLVFWEYSLAPDNVVLQYHIAVLSVNASVA